MSGVFPYPGDDPATLSSLSSTLSVESSNVNTAMTELSHASSSMKANWESDAATRAGADLAKMNTALSTAKSHFKDASTAVTTYRSSLVSIRSQVDDLRRKYETQNQALQTEGTQLRQADRYGEANDMSATELQKYKNTLTTRETATKGKMDHLQTEYDALVKKANTATTTCKTALQNSITGYAYNGSTPTTVGLDQALGVSNFGLLHQFQAQQAAKGFEKDIDGINDPTLSPDERERRIKALEQKYAAWVNDPDFATTVANDKGQSYFQKLSQDIAKYQRHVGGQYDFEDVDGSFFKFNAQILATATNTHNDAHVSQKWIDDFFVAGKAGVQPNWILDAAQYEKTGVQFPTAFLDATGKNAIWVEEHYKNYGGRWDWQTAATSQYTNGGMYQPIGISDSQDPLGTVMSQFSHAPDEHSQLFTDRDNLNFLLHRDDWDEGGEDGLKNTLLAVTGPNVQDHKAAGLIATNLIHDLGTGKDQFDNGINGDLRRTSADVVGRYMQSLMYGPNDTVPNGLVMSGLSGEGGVQALHLDKNDVAGALNWLYADTHDGTGDGSVRHTLLQSWANTSHGDLAQAIQNAKNGLSDPTHNPGQPALLNSVGNSARVLGLLTQSDINGFGDDQAAQIEENNKRKALFDSVLGALPVPEIPGAGTVTKIAMDAGSDIVKGMLSDSLFAGPDPAGAAHNQAQATGTATGSLNAMPASVITAMSHAGIPVITQSYDDPNTPQHETTTTLTASVNPHTPGASLFTDSQGHLKPYSEIVQNPNAKAAFQNWANNQSYFGDNTSNQGQFTNNLYSSYYQGTLGAQPEGS